MENNIFDEAVVNYDKLLQKNIGYLGKNVNYYAEHKAIIVSQNTNIVPQKILEYGCGIGRNVPYLQEYFPMSKINGYDISAESLSVARRKHPQILFFNGDNLQKYKNTYDESSENTLKTNTTNRHRIEIETVPTFEPRQ
jgi:ubiquinone/menaquinone biosynthesis C-methylase UbiE